MTRYIGDEYLESVDYIESLPPDMFEALHLTGVLKYTSLDQALLLSQIDLVKRYQEGVGFYMFNKFMDKHPEYIEKLKRGKKPTNTTKTDIYS
jgi:hypothetical protein